MDGRKLYTQPTDVFGEERRVINGASFRPGNDVLFFGDGSYMNYVTLPSPPLYPNATHSYTETLE